MRSVVYFIEHLTLRNWVGSIVPRLCWRRASGWGQATHCYVFEGSPIALRVARASGQWLGVTVERLRFRLMEVRDERGLWIRLRVVYQDLAKVQADVLEDPLWHPLMRARETLGRLPTYLAKCVASVGLSGTVTVWRSLLTIRVCEWVVKTQQPPGTVPVLVMERHRWWGALARYASQRGVVLLNIPTIIDVRDWLRRHLRPEFRQALRDTVVRLRRDGIGSLFTPRKVTAFPVKVAAVHQGPRVMVEYYGQLNLKQPERFSDLFFWQQSSLSGRDILMTFNVPRVPLDEAKYAQLAEHGMEAVALQLAATTLPTAPVFIPSPHKRNLRTDVVARMRERGREVGWLRERIADYEALRHFWTECFATYSIQVYLTWFKYNEVHCAIADALQSLGGISAVYQRSYEEAPSPETTIDADVVFGFSQATAEVERRSRSIIPYHVTVGYLGDHRFPLLRENAQRIRQLLHRQGVERILAFADENSLDDARWFFDHQCQQECYAFLLERLLAEPWLGLVLKPKVPATLRRRLGPVAALLDRAMATGRCYLFDEGPLHASYPPAAAALAADVMVHGQLSSATAGFEAALAGVPSLLLDREDWSHSVLYRLGVGRVVFTSWENLWTACREHWRRPSGVPGFGDWSPLLDELDPFRDGRAAERIGTYVHWLLEGFKAGLSRETIMADAAERYAALWGKDKITQVNSMNVECGVRIADLISQQ